MTKKIKLLKLTHSLLGTLLVHCHQGRSCKLIRAVVSPNHMSSFKPHLAFPPSLQGSLLADPSEQVGCSPSEQVHRPPRPLLLPKFIAWLQKVSKKICSLFPKEKAFVPMRSSLPVPSPPSASSLRGARARLRSVGTSSGVDQLQKRKSISCKSKSSPWPAAISARRYGRLSIRASGLWSSCSTLSRSTSTTTTSLARSCHHTEQHQPEYLHSSAR